MLQLNEASEKIDELINGLHVEASDEEKQPSISLNLNA